MFRAFAPVHGGLHAAETSTNTDGASEINAGQASVGYENQTAFIGATVSHCLRKAPVKPLLPVGGRI